jgi:hypothetical protein
MTNRRQMKSLMRRAGLETDPLDYCSSEAELRATIEKFSDAQLLDALHRARQESVRGLTDDELLSQLEEERSKPIQIEEDEA